MTEHRRWFKPLIILIGLVVLIPALILAGIIWVFQQLGRPFDWLLTWVQVLQYWSRMKNDDPWMRRYHHGDQVTNWHPLGSRASDGTGERTTPDARSATQ